MILRRLLPLLLCSTSIAHTTLTGTANVTSTGADYPTGSSATYASYASTITLKGSNTYDTLTEVPSSIISGISSILSGNSSNGKTLLSGSQNATATTSFSETLPSNYSSSSTTSSAMPENTQPCNGYAQFCNRKFSNITYVAAHNSPFVQRNNLASNQMLPVETQLNDGIRMLQFQTHYLDERMYLCHTSCELLNAGPLETYLTTVVTWLQNNPYDVIAILMGNQDFVAPQNYTAPVRNSGLINYVYVPPQIPMGLEDWPTLAEMILSNQRAILMLDYNANQTAIPWLLDEFSQMWETPFSPTDRAFPCTPQRPPNSPLSVRKDRMFMANHNLNVDIVLGNISIDIPAFDLIQETNAVIGYGSLGRTVQNCTREWARPPNFLLVDFYNIGSYNGSTPFNGSVFQVAADANNVTYNPDSCCGSVQSAAIKVSPLRNLSVVFCIMLLSGIWFL